jgi:hypothetical protein
VPIKGMEGGRMVVSIDAVWGDGCLAARIRITIPAPINPQIPMQKRVIQFTVTGELKTTACDDLMILLYGDARTTVLLKLL